MMKYSKILFGMLLIAAVVVTVLFFANDMSFTIKEKSISINLLDGQGNPISENVVLTNPDYKDSDLTVVFDDEETDEEILTLELKSHSSVNYVNHIGTGKQVVMYYDINSTYGLSQVLEDPDFIDVRTGDKVNREWKYVYGILEQYNEPIYSCEEKLSVNGSYYDDCYVSGEETKDKRLWTDYPSRDIQEGKTTIGIEVDVKRNDWIDGVWNIAGLTIDKHAEWTNDLNDNLSGYWDFDEGTGTLIEQKVSLGDGGTGKDMTVAGGLGGQWGTGILGSSYFVNYSQKQEIFNPYGNGSLSINIWVNGTDAGGASQGILGNYDSGAVSNKSLMGVTAAGDLYTSVHDSGSDVFGSKIGPGLTMLTVTMNSTHLFLYLNGTFVSSHNFGNVPVWENRWINISGFADASYNNKAVYTDELGIWTRTLTASEVTQLWNGGSGITYPSLEVTLNMPANNANFTTSSVEFNCSATGIAAIQNVSLYINGEINHTVNDGVETSVELNKTLLFAEGKYNWTCGVADINNDRAFAGNRTFSRVPLLENSQTYNPSVMERSSQTFSVDINYSSTTYTNIQGILNYNNAEYVGTRYGTGNNAIFNSTITIPEVGTRTNFTFYWEFTLTDGASVKANSSFGNQTVNIMVLGGCGESDIALYNFTIVDEKTQAKLVGANQNTSAITHIELYTSGRGSLVANFSQNFTKTNPFRICINDSLAGGETYILDAQIQYGADFYATEFYHIQTAEINASTLAQNITLFDLRNTTSTTFQVTYKDSNFIPLADALIQIQRKYIGEGIFKTVEIPKTDSDGQAIAHLEEENAVYTFIIVKDGVIKATFTNFLVKCEDPVLGTCEINLNAFKTHLEPETFINTKDFSFTLTYNETTRTVQSIYTIPSGLTATVLLNVTLADGLGTTEVCSDSLTSASGTISCTAPLSFGNSTITATIYKDDKEVARGMVGIQESPSDLYGANLMFLGFLLIITLVGVGLGSSPMISGIFLIIGGVLGIAFNLVANTGFFGYGATFLWLIIAVIIILMKGARRE